MKKKIIGLGIGVMILVTGGAVVVHHIQEKAEVAAANHQKAAEEARYKKALKAIRQAEESLKEEDVTVAQGLVDKVGEKRGILQGRLDTFKMAMAWKPLEDLLAKAEANPLDDGAAQAAKAKYDELNGNPKTEPYYKNKSYLERILYGLLVKKGDKLVSQAEASFQLIDIQTAQKQIDTFFDAYAKRPAFETSSSQLDQFWEEGDNLQVRLNAVVTQFNTRAAEAASAQAAAQIADQGGNYSGGAGGYVVSGDGGGYVAPSGDGTGGIVQDYGSQWNGKRDYTYDPSKWTTYTLPDGREIALAEPGSDQGFAVGIFKE